MPGAPSRLVQVVFPPPDAELRARDGEVRWEEPLPAAAALGRTTLARPEGDPTRELAFVGEEGQDLLVHRLSVKAGERRWAEPVRVEGARLLAACDGDIRAGERVDAAWLVEAAEGEVALAQVWWEDGPGQSDLLPVARAPEDPITAAVVRWGLLPAAAQADPEWAFQTQTGRIHSSRCRWGHGELQAQPQVLDLIPLEELWLPGFDAEGGVTMVKLPRGSPS